MSKKCICDDSLDMTKVNREGTATREQSDSFLVAFMFVDNYTTPE
jgi:hypothetical protein